MFCWGKIDDEPWLAPKNVEDCFCALSEIKDISCGWKHTAVLKNDGVICTCGSNENGQLGHHKDVQKLG